MTLEVWPSVDRCVAYTNMIDWRPKDLYVAVGRDRLTDPLKGYQRLTGRVVTRGVVAFQIVCDDLEPASLAQAMRWPTASDAERSDAYLVLELRSIAGLSDRAYPARITMPKQ